MPKSGKVKAKLVKQVKVLHPNSRKAMKITGGVMRKDRIGRVHNETSLKMGILVEKLSWFHENLDPEKTEYSRLDLSQMMESYLHRFDEELEQIDIIQGMKSRKGRQHAAREDVIRTTMTSEENLFNTCGLEAPDLTDKKTLGIFLEWDGTARHVNLIKMRKVTSIKTSSKKEDSKTTSRSRKETEGDR
ncbi:translation machinery-associated protein 16-like [Asterias rubens]|uniref:translation machinery-associated protein 16-like n=1 Tax=Asterias rubens TaxID=7604 RepID=UPI0014557F56|nr:translation machinery-associated protein 16-like [Asterias rubens]